VTIAPTESSSTDFPSRSDLSEAQRKEYIAAVLCLQKLPPKSPRDKFPGALNRFDDFVATHESMAMELHSTVSLVHTSSNIKN
jgi:tyrosinase